MKKIVSYISATAMSLLLTSPVAAQAPTPVLGQINTSNSGLANSDLSVLIGSLIQVLLSVLGVILLLIIIYSGILWMTAGGNTDQVGKAKSWMINSVIGLLIILASMALSQFVIGALRGATGTTGI